MMDAEALKSDLLQTTVVMAVDEAGQRVLLGRKQRGFGMGKFTSYGGKLDPGESPLQCVQREFREEACLDLPQSAFEKVGEITFHIHYQSEETFFCHIYRIAGPLPAEAQASEEMHPHWFPLDALPMAEMWADNPHWLPLALKGRRFIADFAYRPDNESLRSYHVRLVDGFGDEE